MITESFDIETEPIMLRHQITLISKIAINLLRYLLN